MNQSNVIRRKVALSRQLIEFSQNAPSLVFLAGNRIRVSKLRAHKWRASRAGNCLLKLGDCLFISALLRVRLSQVPPHRKERWVEL